MQTAVNYIAAWTVYLNSLSGFVALMKRDAEWDQGRV